MENEHRTSQEADSKPEVVLDLSSHDQKPRLRVLHVDDDRSFAEMSKRILEIDERFEVEIATSVDEAICKLKEKQFDVVVSDYEMPSKNGLQLLSELRIKKNEIPFILFTGRDREEVAIAALNLGADRYINKYGAPETVYFELANAINVVVESKKAKKMLAESESKYRMLVENSLQGIAIVQGFPPRIVFANQAMAGLLGYSVEELSSLSPQEVMQLVYHKDNTLWEQFKNTPLDKQELAESWLSFQAVRKDGLKVWVEGLSSGTVFNGQPAAQCIFLNITERVEAERKNRESEEKYKELANALPQIVFEADLTGKITFFSEQALKITGYALEELKKGMYMLQFVIPEQRERVIENTKKSLAGKGEGPNEYTLMRRDGTTYPALVKTAPIISENKVIGLRGIVLDITERKKGELLLREQRDRAEKYLNIVGNIILALDSEGKITLLNKKGYEILGYDDGELEGKDWIETCLPTENRTEIRRLFEACFLEESMPEFHENAVIKKNGEQRIVRWFNTLLKDAEGNIIGTLSSGEDITEQKKTEQMLRESEEKFRELAEESPNMIFINKRGTVVYANKKCVETMGYAKEEFYSPTFNFLSLTAPESVEKIRSSFKRHSAGEEIDPYEYTLLTKDGKRIDAIITSKLIDFEGERAILGIVTDITDIRKVQDALMKSESKYRQLVELAQEGVWALDNNGVTVFVNPRMAKMLGHSEGEMVGKSIFEFIDKDHVGQARAFLLQFKHGITGQFEYAFPRKDGTHVWTSAVASNITDDEGHLVGTLALVADITERKQSEEALRESEERFRAIVANSPIGIATSDIDKHFLSANEAFCKILGYSEDELRKLTFRDITCPEDIRESVTKMQELEAGTTPCFTLEKRYVRKDGSLINGKIMVSATRDQAGKPTLFIAELEDISERKKKERELRDERSKLEAITQSIGAGFVVISKDYHVEWANKFIKDYKGDVEGKLCYATLNELNHICLDCGVKKIFENGANFDAHEYSSIDIKGNPYWVEIIATPIRDETGKVVSAIEIAIDITEKKNLQRKLSEYSQNLEKIVNERTEELKQTQAKLVKSERLAAIGELAAMIGHDLRNPLAGMRNAVFYLNKHLNSKMTLSEQSMLQIINDCIDHSNGIVNDLLEYSRDIKLELSNATPKELLRRAKLNLEFPEGVQVSDLTEDEPVIAVDVSKMTRVFVNLLKNAFDAMPNGGSIEIASRMKDNEVEITLKDTGGGMSEETLGKIWTPLFTTKAKGMGFGLAICKRFVEAHCGKINVTSNVGKGTTFTINIPRIHQITSQDSMIIEPQASKKSHN